MAATRSRQASQAEPRINRLASSRHGAAPLLIVGVGASAGGLHACENLLKALPEKGIGMAFILIQHLDPTHKSMMVDLLSGHTSMTVLQAAEGMVVEKDHLYVIPPAIHLSISGGKMHLSSPKTRHGARLPFDHLLISLAADQGRLAVGVVLSGNGADGSLGIAAVKEKGGLTIAQTPAEAGYDGMPRSAILTGAVDLVLDIAKIPRALTAYRRRLPPVRGHPESPANEQTGRGLTEIVDLLRAKTPPDFRLYKPGTLRRRIERRMAMAAIGASGMGRYLDILRDDGAEAGRLARDLLIHVTSFFRDPAVFAHLAEQVIPDLVRGRRQDAVLRIWVAGCSTGEETYSLAIVFQEEIARQKLTVKLQLFASDVDAEAIAAARDGFYPHVVEADVSAERLERFFTREQQGYRIKPELRACVVFAVQDLLTDPPFSRIDMISCRNLLIYLRPEAQAKVISLFHFALRDGGILLLGSAETVGNADGHFKIIARPEKIYRHLGHSQPGETVFAVPFQDGLRLPARLAQLPPPSRQISFAGLCQRLLMESFAPAAVLIDRRSNCLYSLGPTDRYLRVPSGPPTNDLLAMARPELAVKLKAAIDLTWEENRRMSLEGGQIVDQGAALSIRFDLLPLISEDEELMLVCFLDRPSPESFGETTPPTTDIPRINDLERSLAATRAELRTALRTVEITAEEHKAINEEALSINEEYQSANEELLTSKEELQSLNEELTALNAQLQETLEKQRTTANDLENVLFSTNVATLFLDTKLRIRFFTPATRSLFNVIPGDVGRPLADLHSLAADSRLLQDAVAVLHRHDPIEREIEVHDGTCYIRRILPYRTQTGSVEGVVVTFVDVTERRRIAEALEMAKQRAELANTAKSHFLAAASHDLRQPLQTLALLQGFLTRSVQGGKAGQHVKQLGDALGAMTGILNTLLDINEIEAGTVHSKPVAFPIKDLLVRLRDEFTYQATAQGLGLHVVVSGLWVVSDPQLLEQILRNLLANALKYTKKGRVLFGCRRRRDGVVSIEIWDTGIGIADEELLAIFDEYHQLDNPARERSRGLGLGLSIVRRLVKLLGHQIAVRSHPGQGSVFAVELKQPSDAAVPLAELHRQHAEKDPFGDGRRGALLVVDDDPDLRELLEGFLNEEGHFTASAYDGYAALALVARNAISPDLLLVDFNLPNGMNGLELAARLRATLHKPIPVIVLTGDISNATAHDILAQNCVVLLKPVNLDDLTASIHRLLHEIPTAAPPPKPTASPDAGAPVIFVVDDDSNIRAGIRLFLEEEGHQVRDFVSCEDFLAAYHPGQEACLLLDAYLPGMKGIELLQRLKETGHPVPTIMITGKSDVPMAVLAMKSGAADLLEKPFDHAELLACIERALEQSRDSTKLAAWQEDAAGRIAGLTPRQRQIMGLILSGVPNKNIAADLGISQRTVEHHRASIMEKTASKSLPALARLAVAAARTEAS